MTENAEIDEVLRSIRVTSSPTRLLGPEELRSNTLVDRLHFGGLIAQLPTSLDVHTPLGLLHGHREETHATAAHVGFPFPSLVFLEAVRTPDSDHAASSSTSRRPLREKRRDTTATGADSGTALDSASAPQEDGSPDRTGRLSTREPRQPAPSDSKTHTGQRTRDGRRTAAPRTRPDRGNTMSTVGDRSLPVTLSRPGAVDRDARPASTPQARTQFRYRTSFTRQTDTVESPSPDRVDSGSTSITTEPPATLADEQSPPTPSVASEADRGTDERGTESGRPAFEPTGTSSRTETLGLHTGDELAQGPAYADPEIGVPDTRRGDAPLTTTGESDGRPQTAWTSTPRVRASLSLVTAPFSLSTATESEQPQHASGGDATARASPPTVDADRKVRQTSRPGRKEEPTPADTPVSAEPTRSHARSTPPATESAIPLPANDSAISPGATLTVTRPPTAWGRTEAQRPQTGSERERQATAGSGSSVLSTRGHREVDQTPDSLQSGPLTVAMPAHRLRAGELGAAQPAGSRSAAAESAPQEPSTPPGRSALEPEADALAGATQPARFTHVSPSARHVPPGGDRGRVQQGEPILADQPHSPQQRSTGVGTMADTGVHAKTHRQMDDVSVRRGVHSSVTATDDVDHGSDFGQQPPTLSHAVRAQSGDEGRRLDRQVESPRTPGSGVGSRESSPQTHLAGESGEAALAEPPLTGRRSPIALSLSTTTTARTAGTSSAGDRAGPLVVRHLPRTHREGVDESGDARSRRPAGLAFASDAMPEGPEQDGATGDESATPARLSTSDSAVEAGRQKLIPVGTGGSTVQESGEFNMPSLTLQTPQRSQPSGDHESGGRSVRRRRASESEGSRRTDRRRTRAPNQDVRSGRRSIDERRAVGSPAPGGRQSESTGPPEGRDTATMYPELTVKTLAPRIDATRQAESRTDITYVDSDHSSRGGSESATVDNIVAENLSRETQPADVTRIVERVYREIERKRRIERERRGL